MRISAGNQPPGRAAECRCVHRSLVAALLAPSSRSGIPFFSLFQLIQKPTFSIGENLHFEIDIFTLPMPGALMKNRGSDRSEPRLLFLFVWESDKILVEATRLVQALPF